MVWVISLVVAEYWWRGPSIRLSPDRCTGGGLW